jgi:uncharacterized protein (TIGR02145 family)
MKNLFKSLALSFLLTTILLISGCYKYHDPFVFPEPQPCPEISEVNYDGTIYPTVQIGQQCWLTKSLNIGKMIPLGQMPENNNTIEKYCYDNDTANCSLFGGYYNWNELMRYSEEEGTQGICPDGWHIPTNKELADLLIYVGCEKSYVCLEEKNSTGMNLQYSGFINSNGSNDIERNGYYWTSKEFSTSESIHFQVGIYGGQIRTNPIDKNYYCSVRCIKDQ